MKRLRASNGGKMLGYTRREFGQVTLAAAALPRARDGSPANIGEGDLQVAGILRTIRDSQWEIACILEQGRTGFDSSVAATRANLDYMRKVLES